MNLIGKSLKSNTPISVSMFDFAVECIGELTDNLYNVGEYDWSGKKDYSIRKGESEY